MEPGFQVEHLTDKTVTKEKLNELLALLSTELTPSVSLESIQQALSSSQTIVLGSSRNGSLVGTASVVFSYCVTGTRARIEDVAVNSGYRGMGIGTQLIKEAVQHAEKLNAKSIDLTSRIDREAANRLYKKLGFVKRDSNVYRYSA
ncbi:acyl-CoA N-acyltransferase [Sporodiniella umbellata]|nr:acyl-CoA N-acyltransferase [Sporodiniella umbellata]